MDFEGQREGEKIICIFRRHIVTALKGVLFCIVMVGLGFLPVLMWPGDSRMYWVWGTAGVIGLLGIGYSYILWYFSFYMLTNQRRGSRFRQYYVGFIWPVGYFRNNV
jgi:hypothetical protein